MAIQVQGAGGTVVDADGSNYKALRVALRPLDPGSLGSYGVALASGIMAAGLAASAPVFSFRWAPGGGQICVVHRVTMGMSVGGTAFTAGAVDFRLVMARSFTASDSSGTPATLTGNNGKLRTSYPTTNLTDCRIASTATLTAGTRTLDSQGIANLSCGVGATAGIVLVRPGSEFIGYMQPPIVLVANEGFVVLATVPATGTWSFGVAVQYTEVTAY